jgi:hypothetical protein
MTDTPYVAKNNIAAIRDEFHDWNALEIEPGFTINDLISREECNRAQVIVQGQVNVIIQQIASAKLSQAKGQSQLDTVWMMRAQNAIRWKRRLITAIHAKRSTFPKAPRPPGNVIINRQEAILQIAEEEVGRDHIKRWVEKARARTPELFAKPSAGGEA